MQRLFTNENFPIYTDRVSDEEFYRMISAREDSEMIVKYYDEVTEEVLKEHFNVKKCPNKHIWYGEWENHRRIAIELHKFYSYEVRFGYNYDFIPILNNQDTFVYHRTDKAVALDVMDLYFNHITYKTDGLTHMESFNIRRKYQLPEYGNINEAEVSKEYIRDVIKTNIFFMKDFYETYQSDEQILHFLDHTIEKGNMFQRYRYIWTKAFLYAKLQDMDKAIETMGHYYEHRNGEIPKKVVKKLESVKEMSFIM